MPHNTDDEHCAEQIRGIVGNHHHPPEKHDEHQDHSDCAEDAQLLADDREDHVVLRLRQEAQLLHTLPEALSPYAAAADGIQCLQGLEALALRLALGIKPRHNSLTSEAAFSSGGDDHEYQPNHSRHAEQSHDDKLLVIRARNKNHQHRDTHNDDGGAEVLRDQVNLRHNGERHYNHKQEALPCPHIFPNLAHHDRQKEDHAELCYLRRLQIQSDARNANPSSCTVRFDAKRRQNQRNQPHCHKIAQKGEPLPEVVRNIRHKRHQYQSENDGDQLLLQVICGVPEALKRLIGACRIDHDQSEAEKEQHDKQKAVIEKILRLFFFSSFCRSLYSHRHSPFYRRRTYSLNNSPLTS